MGEQGTKLHVAAQVYQAVGVLLSDAGRFDDPDGIALLDACSYLAGNREHPPSESLLPFQSKERAETIQPQPDMYNAFACDEHGKYIDWSVQAQSIRARLIANARGESND